MPKATFEQLNKEALKLINNMKEINDELTRIDETDYDQLKRALKEERSKFEEDTKNFQLVLQQLEKKSVVISSC